MYEKIVLWIRLLVGPIENAISDGIIENDGKMKQKKFGENN